MEQKINKNTVIEDFPLNLALVDLLPVIFFGLTSIFLGLIFNSLIFIIGALITFISGLLKVIWKIIVATKKKNIWFLFIQMRIIMPIGFLIMIVGFILYCLNNDITLFFNSLFNITSIIFLILGLIGLVAMIICSIKLDSSDLKSNWIEEGINSVTQLFIFIAILVTYLIK